jgi:hypothetical protein
LSDTALVATTGYSAQLVRLSAVTGAVLGTYVIDDPEITRLNDVAVRRRKYIKVANASWDLV